MEKLELHKAEKLKNLIDFKEDDFNAMQLAKNNDSMLLLLALKKGQVMPEHLSYVNAFIYLIEGEIEFIINRDEIPRFKIEKHEIFAFEANEKHSLRALKDSKAIVIRI